MRSSSKIFLSYLALLSLAIPLGNSFLLGFLRTRLLSSDLFDFQLLLWIGSGLLLVLGWLIFFLRVRRSEADQLHFERRVKAELNEKMHALVEERDRFETIFAAMQEGVIVLDNEGNIRLVNPALEKLFRLRKKQLGRPLIEAIRNADLQAIADESLSGRLIEKREIRVLKEGREYFFLVQATSVAENTAALGAIIVLYDITYLRRLERVRRDFVANVSHELKTPLTSIRGYVETLLENPLPSSEPTRSFLDIIDANARRLEKLIEDLLRLSEIESHQFLLKPESFRVQSLIGEILDLQDAWLKRKNMSVDIVIEPETLVLSVDRAALFHILNNLLENAVKYGYADTSIGLQCRAEDSSVTFSVRDRGIGIAKHHLDRIFERFYRVDKSRSKQVGGTGLGLAIVKHLVQLLGGEIRVESQETEGSIFTFTLPKAGLSSAPSKSLAK